MRVYRFQSEQTLDDLIRKLYVLKKPGLTFTNIGKQLAKANPQLDLAGATLGENLPLGTVIVAPDVDGADFTADAAADPVETLPTANLIAAIGDDIASAQDLQLKRLNAFRSKLRSLIDAITDNNVRKQFVQLSDGLDQQKASLAEEKQLAAETMQRASEALDRQRELLKTQ
jgi:hypothetical protein